MLVTGAADGDAPRRRATRPSEVGTEPVMFSVELSQGRADDLLSPTAVRDRRRGRIERTLGEAGLLRRPSSGRRDTRDGYTVTAPRSRSTGDASRAA